MKLRSAHNGILAKIKEIKKNLHIVKLSFFYKGISPGQACVIYTGKRMMGGGWISKI